MPAYESTIAELSWRLLGRRRGFLEVSRRPRGRRAVAIGWGMAGRPAGVSTRVLVFRSGGVAPPSPEDGRPA